MKARDIRTTPVVTAPEDATLQEDARAMLERGIACAVVVDDLRRLAGLATVSDFAGMERGVPVSGERFLELFGTFVSPEEVERAYAAARTMQVRDIMSSPVIGVDVDTPLAGVVETMSQRNPRRIPVTAYGALVGLVARRDLLRVIAADPAAR